MACFSDKMACFFDMDDMNDIVIKIITFCDILTFLSLTLTCKKNCNAINDNASVWCDFVNKNFEERIIKANASFGKVSFKELYVILLNQQKAARAECLMLIEKMKELMRQ